METNESHKIEEEIRKLLLSDKNEDLQKGKEALKKAEPTTQLLVLASILLEEKKDDIAYELLPEIKNVKWLFTLALGLLMNQQRRIIKLKKMKKQPAY